MLKCAPKIKTWPALDMVDDKRGQNIKSSIKGMKLILIFVC